MTGRLFFQEPEIGKSPDSIKAGINMIEIMSKKEQISSIKIYKPEASPIRERHRHGWENPLGIRFSRHDQVGFQSRLDV